ncbi:class I SAM-dependent methyltransferase [Ornithinibacter aureus]|uniref:Class I SAM-dependent methyltransferase n=1 Tax=Ornithinibacter aureus TaxID=622664 RepID=A0ABP8JZZ3_9MICO|nr:class I SAM-dependent methyltransferase [Ornithinibacter aureus]KAF0834270.1 methyltransferase family protein [Ornithinibacter aureus]
MTGPRQWWTDRVVPRLVDRSLDDRLAGPWREQVCGHACGVVLELGFGSGRTLPFYPDSVTRVLAVDPSDLAWEMAADRLTASRMPVERVSQDAASLPLAPESVDTVVSTWSLCTIPDLDGALAEVRRVLRPGGSFRFVEHALAASPRMARVQRAIQPVWGRVAGGCHVDRDILGLVRGAGFEVDTAHEGYLDAVTSPASWFVMGSATPGSS